MSFNSSIDSYTTEIDGEKTVESATLWVTDSDDFEVSQTFHPATSNYDEFVTLDFRVFGSDDDGEIVSRIFRVNLSRANQGKVLDCTKRGARAIRSFDKKLAKLLAGVSVENVVSRE